MDVTPPPNPEGGPFLYTNWSAARENRPQRGAREYGLYTDAHLTGSIQGTLGPYSIINTIAGGGTPGVARKAAVLRVELHGDWELVRLDGPPETDVAIYHAGGIQDEMAALLSLVLGVRMKSGDAERIFLQELDARGQPLAQRSPDPVLLVGGRGFILPSAVGTRDVRGAQRLDRFLGLSPDQAVALVRAARAYQSAVWIAEAEPESSWVLLVSAIEHAAAVWALEDETPEQVLRTAEPELATEIERQVGRELFLRIAARLAPLMASARKFIRFVLEFLPDQPMDRPPLPFRHDWSQDSIRRSLRLIYRYRSLALHQGIPFPLPMCWPPYRGGDWTAPSEIPEGLGVIGGGGAWAREDLPMHLGTFEYIVRGALLNWWDRV